MHLYLLLLLLLKELIQIEREFDRWIVAMEKEFLLHAQYFVLTTK